MQRITMIYALILAVVFGCACGRAESAKPAATPAPTLAAKEEPAASAGRELIALAESEEEAEDIAAQYGIELISFSYGVAVFHTEEDPESVIARGEENGWPSLSLNGESSAY